MQPVNTVEHAGITVNIYPDECPLNPREDGEPLGTIWGDHRRYNIGDGPGNAGALGYEFSACVRNYAEDLDEWPATIAALLRTFPGAVVMPVYLNEYDGTLSAGEPVRHVSEMADWDGSPRGWTHGSGHRTYGRIGKPDGVTFMLPETMFKESGRGAVVNAEMRDWAESILKAELAEYSAWASGDVYGIEALDPATGEPVPDVGYSVWGFYGWDYAEEAAKEMAEDAAAHLAARAAQVGQAAAGLPLYSAD